MKSVRRRYLALEIESNELLDSKEFMDAVWNAILKLYGEYGASHMGLALIDYDKEKGFVVIRIAHTALGMVRTALASMTKIGNKPAAVHVLIVSGTIRSLYKKMTKQPS